MEYNKESFLAGVAVGRQLSGRAGSGGVTVTGQVYIYNTGAAELDISTLDFSQFSAGCLICVVGDMEV